MGSLQGKEVLLILQEGGGGDRTKVFIKKGDTPINAEKISVYLKLHCLKNGARSKIEKGHLLIKKSEFL